MAYRSLIDFRPDAGIMHLLVGFWLKNLNQRLLKTLEIFTLVRLSAAPLRGTAQNSNPPENGTWVALSHVCILSLLPCSSNYSSLQHDFNIRKCCLHSRSTATNIHSTMCCSSDTSLLPQSDHQHSLLCKGGQTVVLISSSCTGGILPWPDHQLIKYFCCYSLLLGI